MLVRRLLGREAFDPVFQGADLIAQFSSLGSISSAWLDEFRASFCAGAARGGASGIVAGGSSVCLLPPQAAHGPPAALSGACDDQAPDE